MGNGQYTSRLLLLQVREPGSSQSFWGKVKNEPSILFTAQERQAGPEKGRAVNGKPWAVWD